MKYLKFVFILLITASSFTSCVVRARARLGAAWVPGHYVVGPYGGRHWVRGHYN